MTHINDWLDDPETGPDDVKEWLTYFCSPAKDHDWLMSRKLCCTYKDGKRYRCIGCGSLGDVWLTKHFEREKNGYILRIDIDDCTDWEVVSNAEGVKMECKHGTTEPCNLCAEEDAEHDSEMAIQARIDAAVAAECERCAKVCEQADKSTHPADLADLIRAAHSSITAGAA